MNNFMLRFFYELFLEVCLCALVNVALTDFDSFSPGLQWVLSCVVLGGIFVYLCWLLSLFCCKGPYLPGFYKKGTSVGSLWKGREVNMDYGANKKLQKIKRERANRRRKRFARDFAGNGKKAAAAGAAGDEKGNE